jgi:16S rRNA (uracil1498-N3)-methyltransferase
MRLHRFYVSQPLGEEVVIENVSLVSQLTKVFRYTHGDLLILFNGDGYDYCYSIEDYTKKSVTLIHTETTPSYIPHQKITLCLSVIKKDNVELVVQKTTELGVTTIIPILTSRSEKKNISHERLLKIASESAEQCGRGDVPHISPVISLKKSLENITPEQEAFFFNMNGAPFSSVKTFFKHKELVFFIGPEGGFSEEDISLMKQHGLRGCSLGKTILRAETAAITCIALATIL